MKNHMKTLSAQVTNTNHRPRGQMQINVDFDQTGPTLVEHSGQTFCYTFKAGTNLKTGLAVREMATAADARLWITLDASQIWED